MITNHQWIHIFATWRLEKLIFLYRHLMHTHPPFQDRCNQCSTQCLLCLNQEKPVLPVSYLEIQHFFWLGLYFCTHLGVGLHQWFFAYHGLLIASQRLMSRLNSDFDLDLIPIYQPISYLSEWSSGLSFMVSKIRFTYQFKYLYLRGFPRQRLIEALTQKVFKLLSFCSFGVCVLISFRALYRIE